MIGIGGRIVFTGLNIEDLAVLQNSIRDRQARPAALEFAKDFLAQAAVVTRGSTKSENLEKVIEGMLWCLLVDLW